MWRGSIFLRELIIPKALDILFAILCVCAFQDIFSSKVKPKKLKSRTRSITMSFILISGIIVVMFFLPVVEEHEFGLFDI